MARRLDLPDIQGGILREYGGSFPIGRYICLRFPTGGDRAADEADARAFLDTLRSWVTSAVRWPSKAVHYPGEVVAEKPQTTLNIGISFRGLLALGLPTRTLQAFPSEYIDGMEKRAHILGDTERNGFENWDPVWRENREAVHALVILRAQAPDGVPSPELAAKTQALQDLCAKHRVAILEGHDRGGSTPWQDASAIFADLPNGTREPTPKEHFGYTDGISEVAFKEQGADLRVVGGGKLNADGTWDPLATGEFLIGHPDESQELPPAPFPVAFMYNGTFMAYRKLHQNVRAFRDYVSATASEYAASMGVGTVEAEETIKAKFVGRWSDGFPLMAAPTYAIWQQKRAEYAKALAAAVANGTTEQEKARIWKVLVDFRFKDDPEGRCVPLGAHIRRVNTRDMLDYNGSSILNNRRRMLRRGLPYGDSSSPDVTDDSEHGIVFLAYCTSLFRQFEFVQQQWLQYGLDFDAGNDRCPVLGNRVADEQHKYVVPSHDETGKTFFCKSMPQFVETRGGEYFFMPSLTALRMMAMGIVDPT